jgi:hypothetical protein
MPDVQKITQPRTCNFFVRCSNHPQAKLTFANCLPFFSMLVFLMVSTLVDTVAGGNFGSLPGIRP